MNFPSTKMTLAISAMSAALLAPIAASAADNKPAGTDTAATSANTQSRLAYSDREQMKPWSSAKEGLERELKPGQNRAFYTKALADRGFQITSINRDEREAVEYEVVKGNQSYEVQIEFDNAGRATEVEIAPNVWRTDATKAALKGQKVPVATTFQRGNEAYRDRARMSTWSSEKERLEASLEPGKDKGFYSEQLKKLGYQVTSINDNDRDYVEYEVVKGTDTFEVQIDLERGKATDVDVTTNLWQSDATERALEAAGR
jgi:uncharacterized protein YmfQ (DUF2313 family)